MKVHVVIKVRIVLNASLCCALRTVRTVLGLQRVAAVVVVQGHGQNVSWGDRMPGSATIVDMLEKMSKTFVCLPGTTRVFHKDQLASPSLQLSEVK